MVGLRKQGDASLPPSPPVCATRNCHEFTDGESAVCCSACETGKHTLACGVRQLRLKPARSPRYVPAARLRVCGTISEDLTPREP